MTGVVFSEGSTTDEDSLAAELRHRETIPWRSFSAYLRAAGLLLLLLLVVSQLAKHSLMVAIDYWLAHWTSSVIVAKLAAAEGNCTSEQVRDRQVNWLPGTNTPDISLQHAAPGVCLTVLWRA